MQLSPATTLCEANDIEDLAREHLSAGEPTNVHRDRHYAGSSSDLLNFRNSAVALVGGDLAHLIPRSVAGRW
jgi:hypothetical protein